MTAIGFDIPEDITRIVAGLERFIRADVITRHEKRAASASAGHFNIADGTSEIRRRTAFPPLAKGHLDL